MSTKEAIITCGLKTELGSHVLLLYKDESELSEVLVDFANEGIKNNDLCVLVTPKDELAKKIKKQIVKKRSIKKNVLFFIFKDFYFSDGKFSAENIYKKIDSIDQKSRTLRGAADLRDVDENMFDDFYAYEEGLSERYKDKNILLLCAYPTINFKFEQIIKLIQSHMKIIFKEKDVWRISETVQRDTI